MERDIPLVDLKRQYLDIKNEIDAAIQSVINDSAFIRSKYVEIFEKNFARYIGVKHCIGVGNGTDGLFIALKCLGIGVGDEVIVPANSFIATAEAVTLAGGKPVFVDCNDYYNIDIEKIENAISPRTKALIPVHLYGQPAEMDKILDIAKRYNLIVVEDAAQAHGAEYRGKKVGTFGDCAVFSFYPAKILGAYGDGGAIVTNNDRLAERVRMFADHGRKTKFDHKFEGTNSRLDGIQAAVLNVKLRYLDKWIKKRQAIAEVYDDALKGIVDTPKVLSGVKHAYHLYVIQVSDRDRLIKEIKNRGIIVGIHYPTPLPLSRAYKHLGYNAVSFPKAVRFADRILSLPNHEYLTKEEQIYIIEAVSQIIGER